MKKKKGRTYTVWTKEEEQYIIDNFGKITYSQMAENLGKEKDQVSAKIQWLDRRELITRAKRKPDNHLRIEDIKINVAVGDKCGVSVPINERTKKKKIRSCEVFYETKDLIFVKYDKGYLESFKKIDFIIGESQIRRISN